MGHSCTLESLGYFSYRNYQALGPVGLTGLLSLLLGLSCVCLHRKCTLNTMAVSASTQTAGGGVWVMCKNFKKEGGKEGKENAPLEPNQEFC